MDFTLLTHQKINLNFKKFNHFKENFLLDLILQPFKIKFILIYFKIVKNFGKNQELFLKIVGSTLKIKNVILESFAIL